MSKITVSQLIGQFQRQQSSRKPACGNCATDCIRHAPAILQPYPIFQRQNYRQLNCYLFIGAMGVRESNPGCQTASPVSRPLHYAAGHLFIFLLHFFLFTFCLQPNPPRSFKASTTKSPNVGENNVFHV